MKRYILFFVFSLLLVAANAQRQHTHFKRVKIEKQEAPEPGYDNLRTITDHTPITIEASKNTTLHFLPDLKPDQTGLVRLKKRERNPPHVITEATETNPQQFWNKVFEVHQKLRKMNDTEDTQKTLLRTWKWLLIAAAILVAVGVVFIILGFTIKKWEFNRAYIVPIILTSIFFATAIIIALLGIAGRI